MPRKRKSNLPYTRVRNGVLYVVVGFKVGEKRKQVWRRAKDREHAAEVLTELKNEVAQFGLAAIEAHGLTFDRLLLEFRRAHKIPPHYEQAIAEFFGVRKVRSITYADCYQFKQARLKVPSVHTGEPRKVATINRELEALRAVLLYALRHGWIKFNPFAAGPALIERSEEEKRDRVPTPAEEAAILAVCVGDRAHLRPIIIATRDTGLRRGALLSLTFAMVDWENNVLRVPAGNKHKKRPKVVGVTARLMTELRRLWEESDRNPDRQIFGWWETRKENGEEIRTWRPLKDFKKAYATALELAGVEDLRPNDWRHGFSTDLMEAGVPEHLAMKVAGHSSAAIHSIYTNVDGRLALQAAAALDRLHQARAGDAGALDQMSPASSMVN